MFDFDFSGMDFDVDFDLDDFDMEITNPDEKTRIIKPRIDPEIVTQTVHFDHALEFARKIDLSGKTRTFAWIAGSFIFGDIVEALWRIRHVDIKNLYIATLSCNAENIDSWAGLMQYADPPIEHFDLLCSAYFYSHEKWTLVPELYARMEETAPNRFQIAFGAYHTKMILIETHHGNQIMIHGSANSRSSSSVEQIMVEINQKELFEFNRDLIHGICERYGTINRDAKPMTRKETADYFREKKKESESR